MNEWMEVPVGDPKGRPAIVMPREIRAICPMQKDRSLVKFASGACLIVHEPPRQFYERLRKAAVTAHYGDIYTLDMYGREPTTADLVREAVSLLSEDRPAGFRTLCYENKHNREFQEIAPILEVLWDTVCKAAQAKFSPTPSNE